MHRVRSQPLKVMAVSWLLCFAGNLALAKPNTHPQATTEGKNAEGKSVPGKSLSLPAGIKQAFEAAQVPLQNVSILITPLGAPPAAKAAPADLPPPRLSHRPQVEMNPASVMKLVTTYAALDLLTPTYRWKTEVYRDGNLSNGVLNGNLIIRM